jgi:hypothetical protein
MPAAIATAEIDSASPIVDFNVLIASSRDRSTSFG